MQTGRPQDQKEAGLPDSPTGGSLRYSVQYLLTFQLVSPKLFPGQSLETLLSMGRCTAWHRAKDPFCSQVTFRQDPGCQSDFSRKWMCVQRISGIFSLFLLSSRLQQDRRWGDHVQVSSSKQKIQIRFPGAYNLCRCVCFSRLFQEHFQLSDLLPCVTGLGPGEVNELFALCTKFKGIGAKKLQIKINILMQYLKKSKLTQKSP